MFTITISKLDRIQVLSFKDENEAQSVLNALPESGWTLIGSATTPMVVA